jgi:hypothetical protein
MSCEICLLFILGNAVNFATGTPTPTHGRPSHIRIVNQAVSRYSWGSPGRNRPWRRAAQGGRGVGAQFAVWTLFKRFGD